MKPARDLHRYKGDFLANGHRFSDRLKCDFCEKSWEAHQEDPRPCEVVVGEIQAQLAGIQAQLNRYFTPEGLEKTLARVSKHLITRVKQVEARLCEVLELRDAP